MRKLALMTSLVLAALAMTATTAMADTVVTDPNTGEPCAEVSPAIDASNAGSLSTTRSYDSGGCTLELYSGTQKVYYGYTSTHWTNCAVRFDAHIGPDGWGYADEFSYTNCAIAMQPCAGDRLIAPSSYTAGPAPFAPSFSYADASTELNVELCANGPGGNVWGHVSIDIQDDGNGNSVWLNQYDGADAYNSSTYQRHRGGAWFSLTGDYIVVENS